MRRSPIVHAIVLLTLATSLAAFPAGAQTGPGATAGGFLSPIRDDDAPSPVANALRTNLSRADLAIRQWLITTPFAPAGFTARTSARARRAGARPRAARVP